MAILNFVLSAWVAEKIGLSFIQIMEKWIDAISVSKEYSGIFLMAIERWETGLLQLTVAFFILLFFVIWLHELEEKRENLKILSLFRNG